MVATPNPHGARKAAIVLFSLDRKTADLLLARMDPQQAERLRQAASQLSAVDQKEQEEVLAEFCRLEPRTAQRCPPGIELDTGLARRLAESTPAPATEEPQELGAPGQPFCFLREAEVDKLVRILATERSQVIAVVLSHLPPQSAGNVLVRLAPPVQVDVVRRLADLEETDPEILREVERGLQRRLSEQVRMQRRRVAGLAAVGAILQAVEPNAGMQILDRLAQHDRSLMERLSPGRLEFGDLMELDDRTLATTIAAADPEVVLLALIGAPPQWLDRFLAHVPEGEAKAVRYRLDHFGPVRLSDVDEARRRVAELAKHLALEGRIELPRRAREAALT